MRSVDFLLLSEHRPNIQMLRQVILIIQRPHGHVTHADTSTSISEGTSSSFLGVVSK